MFANECGILHGTVLPDAHVYFFIFLLFANIIVFSCPCMMVKMSAE